MKAHRYVAAATGPVVVVLVAAGTALAAQAPLRLPDPATGALKRTSHAHLEVRLPAGFRATTSPLTGARVDGVWERQFGSGATGCTVTFTAEGKGRRARPRTSPRTAPWANGRFRVTHRGHDDAMRWWAGHAGSTQVGLASLSMPRGLATARARWAEAQLRLDRGAGVARVCDAAIAKLAPSLRSSLRRVRVVRDR